MIRAPPMILQAMVTCTTHTQDQASQNPHHWWGRWFPGPSQHKEAIGSEQAHGSCGNHCFSETKLMVGFLCSNDWSYTHAHKGITNWTYVVIKTKTKKTWSGKGMCWGYIKKNWSVKLGGKYNHNSLHPCIIFSKIKWFKRKLSIQ